MSRALIQLRRLRHRLRHRAQARAARLALMRHAQVPAPQLDLALVIPVWNDAAGLARLLERARALGVFSQIIVVDDGSDVPVPQTPDVTLIRHKTPLGGGVARNAGLDLVTAQHVLFFDADDLILPPLAELQRDLARHLAGGAVFDFCLFKHADSRVSLEPRWGQPDWDDALWARAGHGCGALAPALPEALHVLAQTANYPWNKIYRTAFLRAHGLRCAATAVHQDIPLHWLGFVAADNVLVSDRICAWHGVQSGAARLTNRAGRERLQVFAALAPVVNALAQRGDAAWQGALMAFLPGLMEWIEARIDPVFRDEFEEAKSRFLAETVSHWRASKVGSP